MVKLSNPNWTGVPIAWDPFDFRRKELNAQNYFKQFLHMYMQKFEYTGLPDTLPKWAIESNIDLAGYVIITDYTDGKPYAYYGSLGGVPNQQYRPTEFIIANPGQQFNKVGVIGIDGVVIQNNTTYTPITPQFMRYASQLADIDLSLYLANTNSRIQNIIIANDDTGKASAEVYLKGLEEGRQGAVVSSSFAESKILVQPYATGTDSTIKTLMEYRTYVLNSAYNCMGLQANVNLKRENISEMEASQNEDHLFPSSEEELEWRKRGIDEVNNMYGLNIEVEFSNIWKERQGQMEHIFINGDETEGIFDEQAQEENEEVVENPEETEPNEEEPTNEELQDEESEAETQTEEETEEEEEEEKGEEENDKEDDE
jgi:hypothetical protein